MRRALIPLGSLVLLFILLSSCASPHRVFVRFDRTQGLNPGDPIYWEDQVIGTVGAFEENPKGDTVVLLRIHPDFRQRVTEKSRFLIQSDPKRPGCQAVKMALLAAGGKPLPDGATVQGSTATSFLLESASQEIHAWLQTLREALDRWEKGMKDFSERQWQKELEAQIENWTRELKAAGEDLRRHFRNEILPRLEKAVRDLLRRLRELGREEEGISLTKKWEQLQRVLEDERGPAQRTSIPATADPALGQDSSDRMALLFQDFGLKEKGR